jgi:hypothetical protein
VRPRPKAGEPPAELRDFTLWGKAMGVYVERDLTPLRLPTIDDYRAATADRWRCYQEWRDARQRFAQTHDWPGGEEARWAEEVAVAPGAPFNPDTDI